MTQSIGPPSLAQGTRIAVGFSTSISRFIPACGELSKPSWAIVQLDGSSPLARGTRHYLMRCLTGHRFIPAYAGNSNTSPSEVTANSVHPRLRGELSRSRTITIICLRFIPAYAGNSTSDNPRSEDAKVHPRLRGELDSGFGAPSGELGSSPLTRGTHLKTV